MAELRSAIMAFYTRTHEEHWLRDSDGISGAEVPLLPLYGAAAYAHSCFCLSN